MKEEILKESGFDKVIFNTECELRYIIYQVDTLGLTTHSNKYCLHLKVSRDWGAGSLGQVDHVLSVGLEWNGMVKTMS